jgi:hypothetical protein
MKTSMIVLAALFAVATENVQAGSAIAQLKET